MHWLYITSNFIKTPSNFIPIILYIFYLSTILLIVPKFLAVSPLYIWNNANFNMKIFNLAFIALICGAAASNIFCIRKDDTVQLIIFSKPIQRKSIILNKIIFYFLVVLGYTLIIVGIIALTPLIFGWYDPLKNITGIKLDDYTSLLLSLFIGNCICSFVFIAIGILIGMKHNTTITMVILLLIASSLNFFNFVIPYMSSKAQDYLQNKYGTTINSYVINTLEQYQNDDTTNNDSINVCTLWSNEDNLDPLIVQKEAENYSNEQIFNYFDIAKQLSQLFHCFPSNDISKQEKKLSGFGNDPATYNYSINEDNIFTNKKTLLFFYNLISTQGLNIPIVNLLGLNLNDIQQVLQKYNTNPNFISIISKNLFSPYPESQSAVDEVYNKFGQYVLNIDNLKQRFADNNLMSFMKTFIDRIVETELLTITSPSSVKREFWSKFIWRILSKSQLDKYVDDNVIKPNETEQYEQLRQVLFNTTNGIDDASDVDRLLSIANFQLGFFVNLMQRQKQILNDFFKEEDKNASYPYTSEQICNFFAKTQPTDKIYIINSLLSQLVSIALPLQDDDLWRNDQYFLHMPSYTLSYCETINQLHEYEAKDFFPTQTLVAVWSTISILMIIIALCIYWKIDIA